MNLNFFHTDFTDLTLGINNIRTLVPDMTKVLCAMNNVGVRKEKQLDVTISLLMVKTKTVTENVSYHPKF